MPVTGLEEILNNVQLLNHGYDRKARKAVREGAKLFGDQLKPNTPVSAVDHSGKEHLQDAVTVGNVSIASGEYEAKVGYDKIKGPIAHFPNSGTSKQDPQHFVEKTQEESREKVLQTFITNLKVGD
ncbi:HK97-gp10 family putative phage morphogenesis protein [Companilactobacillus pabuli]|uniref:HK97-gp10 family putative phage morphogenesis protein n=1 Tax=Companilactobacillus pabuli TaxID=2714036 RepID=UPI002417420A|nr:HK97-gp10 family putative phage morphogenesis protein [Companilactobacillus pabuli]MDG5112785.1 HK97 gp10 family phage protein [Companilactobacillus pabuli]